MTPGIKGTVGLLCAALLLAGQTDLKREGIEAFHAGRYSVAIDKLKLAVRSNSSDAVSVRFLALSEAAAGDCKTALPTLAKDPDVLAGVAAAQCYISSGENGAASALLDRLQSAYPNNADVLYTTAKFHMKAFNDATFRMFEKTPASYRVHELSAEIFEVESKYPDAAGEYRKAIALNPSAPDLHYRLGRALLMQSHEPASLSEAAAEFQAELRLSPEDGACEFQLGQIAQVQANTAEARTHFEKAISMTPIS